MPMSSSSGIWLSSSGNEEGQQTVRGTVCPTNGTVAIAAGGELHRADVRCGSIHGQMDLAPFAIVGRTMAPQWLISWTSSSCGSGRVMTCSCAPSNRIDSQCESFAARVLQQRPQDLAGNQRDHRDALRQLVLDCLSLDDLSEAAPHREEALFHSI